MNRAEEVITRFREQHLTIATAESLTAGLIAAGLADVPGASAVLVGGAVTYATDRKHTVLGVESDLLTARGAVDPDVARDMARGALTLFDADVAVSATGVAGPTEQDGKPVGTVFVGCAVSARAWQRIAAGRLLRPEAAQPSAPADSPSSDDAEWMTAHPRCSVRGFTFTGDRPAIRRQAANAAWELALTSLTEVDR